MKKFRTLEELRDAFAGNFFAYDDEEVTLRVDNDSTFVYVGEECVFEMHPDEVLDQALTLLRIPHEEC